MTTEEIVQKICVAMRERFGIDTGNVDSDSRLRDLGVDSLHVVEIMLDMETELGIKFQDLSIPPNPSLGEVAAAIQRNMQP